jgi:hypothetical protein
MFKVARIQNWRVANKESDIIRTVDAVHIMGNISAPHEFCDNDSSDRDHVAVAGDERSS